MSIPLTVTGRLARIDELSMTPTGTARVGFAIATSKPKRVGDKWEDGPTTFLSCVAWRELAEALTAAALDKGLELTVTGDLAERTWTGRDGTERKQLELTARTVAVSLTARQSVTVRKVTRTGATTPTDDGYGAFEQARAALATSGMIGDADLDPWATP
jgi:single-stranded DNA-binding protein